MIVKNKVLTWDVDKAENDGYLSTGSFPLSLGNEKEFEKIKKNKEALLFVFEKDNELRGIFCKSRDKYPGELYSILENSPIYGSNFKELKSKYDSLGIFEYFSFSNLFGSILNISKIEKGQLIVRKGIKIELYKTNIQFCLFFKIHR